MAMNVSVEDFDSVDNESTATSNFELDRNHKTILSGLIAEVRKTEKNSSFTTKEKGDLFESVVDVIISGTKRVFKKIVNARTDSNEIDFLIVLTSYGRELRSKGIIPTWFPDSFMIECKNHSSHVKVGLVGKFYSLMDSCSQKLGLFVSHKGITGCNDLPLRDASAFVHKVNLINSKVYGNYVANERNNEKMILLDLDIEDLEKLTIDDMDIIQLVIERYTRILSVAKDDFGSNIEAHPNEAVFKNIDLV